MKKNIKSIAVIALMSLTLISCGESIDGAALSQEICDCLSVANGLPSDDENRSAEQDKCTDLQTKNWELVKGNVEQEKAFNDQFPCGYAE